MVRRLVHWATGALHIMYSRQTKLCMVGVLRMAFAKLEPEAHYISHIESLHPHLKRALRYFFSKRKLLKSLPLINRNIFENSSPAASAAQRALSPRRAAWMHKPVDVHTI